MRSVLFALLAVTMSAATATAQPQPYYARGEFNGWSLDDPLTQIEGVLWRGTVSDLDPSLQFAYKITSADWTVSEPSSDGRVQPNANGDITFNFYDQVAWNDGYKPDNRRRVGYMDPGQFAWEIMGTFNGWSGQVLLLTDMGSGLWTGDLVVPVPGTYEWKFRMEGDWAITIGDDFGNAAANNSYTTTVANEVIHFELDLPGGRWRAVPELGSPNDDCTDALPITLGDTEFSTINATTDGPPLPPECEEGAGLAFEYDIWYTYMPMQSGTLTVSTCNQADYDSRLAAYTGDCSSFNIIACNDDGPGCAGFTSLMEVPVVAGEEVLLRVGGYSFSSGTGILTLSFEGDCAWDLDGNGSVGTSDLLALFSQWGTDGSADFDGSGAVGTSDMLILFANWGPCK